MTDLGIITDMRLAAIAEVVMANLVRTNLRRTILIGATLALSIGTSMTAFAQPGASFQTRSNREGRWRARSSFCALKNEASARSIPRMGRIQSARIRLVPV
jgi:hypothetical protein